MSDSQILNKAPPIPADCFDPRSGLVPIADAERIILDSVAASSRTEVVQLSDCLNRVLARPAHAAIDVPPHANAAMDGFALAGKSLPSQGVRHFKIAGTAYAGKPWTSPCPEGQTVRVMTGAVMPDGTDTVVIQEDVAVSDGTAVIGSGRQPHQNVRHAGEDLRFGSVALDAGTRLGPADLGVLASLGAGRVEVFRQPVAAVFSTGDELRTAGEPLDKGQIYDSNRYVLLALLQQSGIKTLDLGVIPDNPEQTRLALEQASKSADVIISSGGVSTGSADYVINTLRELGDLNLWRIAIRPGRPLAFGRIGDAIFFGLPGNPVAVMVTFYRLVQPSLRKLRGEAELDPPPTMQARAATRFRKKPNRAEVYRAILTEDEDGNATVASTGQQGSGLLSSMSRANCFVLLDDEEQTAEPGDMVKVQLFEGIF